MLLYLICEINSNYNKYSTNNSKNLNSLTLCRLSHVYSPKNQDLHRESYHSIRIYYNRTDPVILLVWASGRPKFIIRTRVAINLKKDIPFMPGSLSGLRNCHLN